MLACQSNSFGEVREALRRNMKIAGVRVENLRWQGIDVSKDPAARMTELQNVVVEVDLRGIEDLDHWRDCCAPNLPWADDHFAERVGGEPLNPGEQWRNWPWAQSADRFRGPDERFNHTYMERLWPRWARKTPGGRAPGPDGFSGLGRRGITHRYGDLTDLVNLLLAEPSTRQAWIPLFHPDDTGIGDGGRKPCTLGYQFIRRGDGISMYYPLRSCDLFRHYDDDCYLAVRLLLWVLDKCRDADRERWAAVRPDKYCMHMTSLHVFENDLRKL